MEALGICSSGLASAAQLLSYTLAVETAEIMDIFLQFVGFYELYDCLISVTLLAEV